MKSFLGFGCCLGAMLVLAVAYHRHDGRAGADGGQEAAPVAFDINRAREAGPARTAAPPLPVAGPRALSLSERISRASRSQSRSMREHALRDLVPQLAASDPASAARFALALEAGAVRDECLRQAMHRWCETDIVGALTWLGELSPGDRAIAAAVATAQVGQSDPAGALELSQLLRVGLDDGSLEHRAQIWAEDRPDAAATGVKGQPPSALRDRLVARVAWVLAPREPAEAATLIATHMSPGTSQTEALLALVRQWAVREAGEAAEWVAHFPAGPLRDAAAVELDMARRQAGATGKR